MKKFWRVTFKVIGLLLLSALLWFGSFLSITRKGEPIPDLKLGPRTTLVTGPLNAAQYPNYCKALNSQISEGIAPEENFWTLFDETMNLSKLKEYRDSLVKVSGFERAGTHLVTPLNAKPVIEPSDLGGLWEPVFEPTWEAPWRAEDYPDLSVWLDENEAVLSKVTEASKRPKSYAPAVETEPDHVLMYVSLPHAQHARLVTRMLCARAMRAVLDDEFDDAWRDIATCQRISGHALRCPSLMEQLVGIAVADTAGSLIPQLLSLETAGEDRLAERWREISTAMNLDPLAASPPLLERMMVIQLHLIFRTGRENEVLDSGTKTPSYWESFKATVIDSCYQTALNKWDINASLEYANDRFDEAERMLALKTYRERVEAAEQLELQFGERGDLEADREAAMSAFVKGNSKPFIEFWRTYATRQFFPAVSQMNVARTRMAQRRILYHALFVAELHRRKTGSPPRDGLELQQAARTYAAAAGVDCPELIDLFLDEPLRVKQDGQHLVIYACGENLIDDDGVPRSQFAAGDLPVVIELR